MNQQQLEKLRGLLEDYRRRFSEESRRKADEGRNSTPDGALDPGDRGESTLEKELLFSESENEAELLQMVNGALARMDDGSYGQCLSCHREIEFKRLESVPWTHYCIECQSRIEQEEAGQRRIA